MDVEASNSNTCSYFSAKAETKVDAESLKIRDVLLVAAGLAASWLSLAA